jgi:nitroreductase
MELNKIIQSRKSAKKFTDKKPDWRDILECIDSIRFTPMAGNNFSLKAILVDNKETIQKISKSAQQPFISQAHHLVVLYSNPTRTTTSFGKRGEIYSRQQAGAAIQNFLLKIQEKKLSTCWVGHFVDNQIKEALKIPDKSNIEAIFPVGYESKNTKGKRKIELDTILSFNTHGNKKMKSPKKLNV